MNPLALDTITSLVKAIINRVWPDPAQQAAANLELAKLVQSGELAQLAADTDLAKAQIGVDNTEAGSENIFKSGWRPMIGWTCGVSFAWNFALAPALTWSINLVNSFGHLEHPVVFAPADMGQMLPVLFGMLGFGAMRTVEKLKSAQ